jgi:small GTP-binding protein
MRRVKILMLGDSGVGKTSLMLRWTTDSFNSNMVSTVGVNFKSRRICVNGEYIQVQVWDTAGQEHFHKITTSYYRGANAIILVYDLSDPRTMDNVHYWLSSIKEHASDSVHLALIGNKVDIRAEAFSPKSSAASASAASSSSSAAAAAAAAAATSSHTDPSSPMSDLDYIRGLEWADKLGVKHFETSAKDSTNVDEAFMTVITSYLNSIDSKAAASSSSGALAGSGPGTGAGGGSPRSPGAGVGAETGLEVETGGTSSATSAASSSPMSPPLSPTTQKERMRTIKKLKRSLFRTLGGSKDKYAKGDGESKETNHNSSQASMGGMSDPEGEDGEEEDGSGSGSGGGLHTKKDKEKCTVS